MLLCPTRMLHLNQIQTNRSMDNQFQSVLQDMPLSQLRTLMLHTSHQSMLPQSTTMDSQGTLMLPQDMANNKS